jgi:hypothetical protein
LKRNIDGVDGLIDRKIHSVLSYGRSLIMAEHVFLALMFDSVPWKQVTKAIFKALN